MSKVFTGVPKVEREGKVARIRKTVTILNMRMSSNTQTIIAVKEGLAPGDSTSAELSGLP